MVQHGMGERGPRSRVTGEPVAGPETLTEAELAAARVPFGEQISDRPLDGEFYRQRSADYAAITVPLLSAANWGGQGLHSRGNFEGFSRAASAAEVAGSTRPGALDALLHRLRDRPAEAVLRLFPARRGPRLAGPATRSSCRSARWTGSSSAASRSGRWPAPSGSGCTCARRSAALDTAPPPADERVSYAASGDGITFTAPPLPADTEITGPVAARLFVSSSDHRRRPVPGAAGVRARPARRSPSPARSTRTPRSRRAGCACRTASSTRA